MLKARDCTASFTSVKKTNVFGGHLGITVPAGNNGYLVLQYLSVSHRGWSTLLHFSELPSGVHFMCAVIAVLWYIEGKQKQDFQSPRATFGIYSFT